MKRLAPLFIFGFIISQTSFSKVRDRARQDSINKQEKSQIGKTPPSHHHWRVGAIVQEGSVIKTIPGAMLNGGLRYEDVLIMFSVEFGKAKRQKPLGDKEETYIASDFLATKQFQGIENITPELGISVGFQNVWAQDETGPRKKFSFSRFILRPGLIYTLSESQKIGVHYGIGKIYFLKGKGESDYPKNWINQLGVFFEKSF